MYSPEKCANQSCEMTTDTELIHATYRRLSRPNCTLKRLARAMGAPTETARSWFHRSIPERRRRDALLALAAQIEQQKHDLAELGARIAETLEDIDRAAAMASQEAVRQSKTFRTTRA